MIPLRSWFFYRWPSMTLALTGRQPAPPPERKWQTKPFHDGPIDHHVWLMFHPDRILPKNAYHVSAVAVMRKVWLWVGPTECDSMVMPIEPPSHNPLQWIEETDPHYIVCVPCSYHSTYRRTEAIGPMACTVLAKRLIGLHDSGVLTSSELLAALWRHRDGRDS